MIQYIADDDHFKEVIARVPNVKKLLWIGTADIKDLYVGDRPFLGVLADLVSRGREVRLIHAKEPGPNFREDFDHYPILFSDMPARPFQNHHFRPDDGLHRFRQPYWCRPRHEGPRAP